MKGGRIKLKGGKRGHERERIKLKGEKGGHERGKG